MIKSFISGLAAMTGIVAATHATAAPVCMSKESEIAAKMSIGMGPQDVAAFAAAGWTPVSCPSPEARIFGGADALCARFNGYDAIQKEQFLFRYGVSTDQLCTASHNYEAELAAQ